MDANDWMWVSLKSKDEMIDINQDKLKRIWGNCEVKVQANCTFSVKEPSVMNNGMTYIVSVGKKRKMFPHRREKTSFNQFFHVRKKLWFFWFSFKKSWKNIFSILKVPNLELVRDLRWVNPRGEEIPQDDRWCAFLNFLHFLLDIAISAPSLHFSPSLLCNSFCK